MAAQQSDILFTYGLPAIGGIVVVALGLFLLSAQSKIPAKRFARVTTRRGSLSDKGADAMSLRRKTQIAKVPFLRNLTSLAALQDKLERAGMNISAEMFITVRFALFCAAILVTLLLKKKIVIGLLVGILLGGIIPRFVVNFRIARQQKRFLTLFPDAIDFIVRGLRSGLPVTESMNMVAKEIAEPVASVFGGIGESVRLGVTLEKALQDTAKKLNSTEFNFFTTSIVLQRETGGNLSEILNNLSDVLRKRFMMRMKIKAMSSEAKATAMIVGSLPFIVTVALSFVAPDYLAPLVTETSGNIAAACAVMSLTTGVTVMLKMAKFEI